MKPMAVIAAAGGIAAASFALSFIHPFGNVRNVPSAGSGILDGSQVPPDIRAVLESKCGDCHSNATHWPVYSRFAPGSWLVERDVMEGRQHLNLSNWAQLDKMNQMDLLTKIGSEARSGEMPVKQYLLLHPSARLTDAEKETIYGATRAERKRLKALTTNP